MISIKVQVKKTEPIVSGAFHIIFGLILFWVSLGAAILFFITDRILRGRNKEYNWLQAMKSLTIPLLAWLLVWGFFGGMIFSLTRRVFQYNKNRVNEMKKSSPKLPLTTEERLTLRRCKVKLSEIAETDVISLSKLGILIL
ncbi:hypothetical protein [Neobacillus jeddahensis]|uniref:hypothetical protein n=1 Tax=Neobacillus jeddahensis TaxID=1461580 RepID=UPI0015CD41D2|nr:hypothetical protein [Neobacillus jeddahensis]